MSDRRLEGPVASCNLYGQFMCYSTSKMRAIFTP